MTRTNESQHQTLAGSAQRRRRLLLCGALLATGAVRPAGAASQAPVAHDHVNVVVEQRNGRVFVQAQADVGASREQAFATLVDYDRLADFVPDLAASHAISRSESSALVEQRGRVSFGPFHQQFRVTLAVEEQLNESIHATLAGGDFRHFDATYRLSELDPRNTRIEYQAELEPTAGIPPLVGISIMRGAIRRQFEAMVAEITRRSAAA